jgi:hypothetical protein
MTIITEITPTEQADRLAIRELVDASVHCADRRLAEGQKARFTEDTHFDVYMNGQGSQPTQVLDGREALTPVFEDPNRYEATEHFNGQSTIELAGERATGESYCIAHHLFTEDGERKLMLAHLRYSDTSSSSTAPGCSPSETSTSTGSRQSLRTLNAPAPARTRQREPDPARSVEQEVSPLELLFDLGVSQLTRHLIARPTWRRAAETLPSMCRCSPSGRTRVGQRLSTRSVVRQPGACCSL